GLPLAEPGAAGEREPEAARRRQYERWGLGVGVLGDDAHRRRSVGGKLAENLELGDGVGRISRRLADANEARIEVVERDPARAHPGRAWRRRIRRRDDVGV